MPDFGTADRAFGIVKNRRDNVVIHKFLVASDHQEAIAHLVAGQNGTLPLIAPVTWREACHAGAGKTALWTPGRGVPSVAKVYQRLAMRSIVNAGNRGCILQ
jgi:hypothetical protein